MNFFELILSLYRSDDISFDADGSCSLSAQAVAEIEAVTGMPITRFWLEETVAYMTIKAAHQSIRPNYSRDLKQALRMH